MSNPLNTVLIILLLAGCAALEPSADPTDRAAVAAETEFTFDAGMGQHKAVAPSVLDYNLFRTAEDCGGRVCNHHSSRYMLRAWSDELPFGQTGAQLHVSARFNLGWALLDSAWSGGRSLPVTVIDRDVVSCKGGLNCELVETLEVAMTRPQLETAAAQGFSVKLQGNRSSVTLVIPAPYFAGFLEALDGRAAP